MSKHYHVVVNQPGYLPDSYDDTGYTTWAEAVAALTESVTATRESYEDEEETANVSQEGDPQNGYVHVVDLNRPYDLGLVHEIVTCTDPACEGGISPW